MNVRGLIKKLLLLSLATMGVNAGEADSAADAIRNAAIEAKATGANQAQTEQLIRSAINEWKFKQDENKKMMSLLGMIGRKAEEEHMKPIAGALETALQARDLRLGYDAGSVDASALTEQAGQLVPSMTKLLEFLSVAESIIEESFEQSNSLDMSNYSAKQPLFKTLIGMGEDAQAKELESAMGNVESALEVLDQVRAIREGLVFNAPGALRSGLATYFAVQNGVQSQDKKELRKAGLPHVKRLFDKSKV